jgi:hypothetical protein
VSGWGELAHELARWRDAGREVGFWLRDDDATRPSAALERLLDIAAPHAVPVALAVVPREAQPALFAGLDERVAVLQHGWDHRNRAAPGEKKTEFPPGEEDAEAIGRLARGREQLAKLAGPRALAVLAPPWNRLRQSLIERLPQAGLRGLSGYGARRTAHPVPGLRQVNTHVDLIAWNSGRGFVGEQAALGLALRHLAARRSGTADPEEPTGWLTHHAVHDEAVWSFLERLFDATAAAPGVRWRHASTLFPE